MRRGMWGKSLGESARRRLFTSNLLFKSCRPKRRCQSNLSIVSILANRSLHQNMMYNECRGTAVPKVCLQAFPIFFSPVPPSTEGLLTGYMFVYNLGQVKCFLLVGFRLVHVNVLAKKRKSPCIQSWTKLLRKLHTRGGIFSNLRSRPILLSSLPLKAVLLGLQKKAGSLSVCGKQLWTGEGGFL